MLDHIIQVFIQKNELLLINSIKFNWVIHVVLLFFIIFMQLCPSNCLFDSFYKKLIRILSYSCLLLLLSFLNFLICPDSNVLYKMTQCIAIFRNRTLHNLWVSSLSVKIDFVSCWYYLEEFRPLIWALKNHEENYYNFM